MSIIYHYCSSDTFASIFNNSTLRLSSLSLSNDSMEGLWVNEIVKEIFDDKSLDKDLMRVAINRLDRLAILGIGLGMCFSQARDALSQWRGYSDDGHGFAVGFETTALEQWLETLDLRPELIPVEYNRAKQKALITPLIDAALPALKQRQKDPSVFKGPADPSTGDPLKESDRKLYSIDRTRYKMKSSNFDEEKEWRIIKEIIGDNFSIRSAKNRLVPYVDVSFSGSKSIVHDVIIGPKNITPAHLIQDYFRQVGLDHVKVTKSELTYR